MGGRGGTEAEREGAAKNMHDTSWKKLEKGAMQAERYCIGQNMYDISWKLPSESPIFQDGNSSWRFKNTGGKRALIGVDK